MKRILSVVLVLILIFSSTASAVDITSKGAYVMDYYTGEELFSLNPDVARPAASMTKVISLYVVFDAIKNGEISLGTETKISERVYKLAADNEYAGALAEDYNITYRVDELIEVALIHSACDATLLLAEVVSGSEQEFVNRMNEKASNMGLNAFFYDSTGIKDNMITPRSMAILAASIINDYPEILTITSKPSISFRGKTYKNTNKLLGTYPGVDGLKTGTTDSAGYCFCATSAQGGDRVIAVTMASKTANIRFTDVSKMFDYAFTKLSDKKVFTTSMTAFINDKQIPCFYTNEFGGCGVIIAEDLVNYGYDVNYDSENRVLHLKYNEDKEFTPLIMDYYNSLEANKPFMKIYPSDIKVVIEKGNNSFIAERVLSLNGYMALGVDELLPGCSSFMYTATDNSLKITY